MAACSSLSSTFNKDTSGAFHPCGGRNVEFSENKTVAQIGGDVKFAYPGHLDKGPRGRPVFNMRRVVFSSKPIETTGIFQVHVTRRKYHKKLDESYIFHPNDKGCSRSDVQQNMGIGFIAYDPARLLVIPEDGGITESWHYCSDVWMLSEDRAYHDGRKEGKHNLCVYQPDSNTIGCRVNERGYLEFIMDGKNHGVVWSKPLPMDRPLWGFVDLPIEYKIQAHFTYSQGPPPPYKPSEDQNPDPHSHTNQRLEQKIADLEASMQKNSQEVHSMQKELACSFQKQLDALTDMQQQFQAQLTQLASDVQNLKL